MTPADALSEHLKTEPHYPERLSDLTVTESAAFLRIRSAWVAKRDRLQFLVDMPEIEPAKRQTPRSCSFDRSELPLVTPKKHRKMPQKPWKGRTSEYNAQKCKESRERRKLGCVDCGGLIPKGTRNRCATCKAIDLERQRVEHNLKAEERLAKKKKEAA